LLGVRSRRRWRQRRSSRYGDGGVKRQAVCCRGEAVCQSAAEVAVSGGDREAAGEYGGIYGRQREERQARRGECRGRRGVSGSRRRRREAVERKSAHARSSAIMRTAV